MPEKIQKPNSIGIILLAAGASRRMNEPKQLLRFGGESLLRRAALAALESECAPVVAVLGANFDKTRVEIEDLPLEIVFNENWQSGLSSSLQAGIEKLLEIAPHAPAFVVALADQPFVAATHINQLIEIFRRTKKPIVAARYGETVGVPALFAREVFADFQELSGDKGAKTIIEKRSDSVEIISLPQAAFDIDTPQDFLDLKNRT